MKTVDQQSKTPWPLRIQESCGLQNAARTVGLFYGAVLATLVASNNVQAQLPDYHSSGIDEYLK